MFQSEGGVSRVVHVSEKGMRLDRYVRIHFPDMPFGLLSGALKRGRLTVDGRRARATDRLAPGQIVALVGAGGAKRAGQPGGAGGGTVVDPADRAFLESILVHADDDLLVFDKPAGLAVHAGTRTTRHLDGLLASFPNPEGEKPQLVHRLDKDTSGIIVAARRRAVAGAIGKALAERTVEKEYRAVLAGRLPAAEGRIDAPLRKIETPAGGRVVVADGDPAAASASTRWRELAVGRQGGRSLVALFPETGRQHQLRVHAAALGAPILGDRLYGSPGPADRVARLHLHAARIAFRHPRGGDVVFEASVPAAFGEVMAEA